MMINLSSVDFTQDEYNIIQQIAEQFCDQTKEITDIISTSYDCVTEFYEESSFIVDWNDSIALLHVRVMPMFTPGNMKIKIKLADRNSVEISNHLFIRENNSITGA